MTTATATKTKPAATKTAAPAKSGKTLLVTQTGSRFRKMPGMKETLIGLGLGRIRSSRELEDTPAIRGMLFKVRHLVSVKEKGK